MPADSGAQIGVDPTPELLAWLWDTGFAAVGSDAVAVEAIPASDGSCESFPCLLEGRGGRGEKMGIGTELMMCRAEIAYGCYSWVGHDVGGAIGS